MFPNNIPKPEINFFRFDFYWKMSTLWCEIQTYPICQFFNSKKSVDKSGFVDKSGVDESEDALYLTFTLAVDVSEDHRLSTLGRKMHFFVNCTFRCYSQFHFLHLLWIVFDEKNKNGLRKNSYQANSGLFYMENSEKGRYMGHIIWQIRPNWSQRQPARVSNI